MARTYEMYIDKTANGDLTILAPASAPGIIPKAHIDGDGFIDGESVVVVSADEYALEDSRETQIKEIEGERDDANDCLASLEKEMDVLFHAFARAKQKTGDDRLQAVEAAVTTFLENRP